MKTKRCSKCGIVRSIDEFHKDCTHKDGRRTDCRFCSKIRTKIYYTQNKEEMNRKGKEYRQRLEVKERTKIQNSRYQKSPEYKLRSKELRQRPEAKEKVADYQLRQYYGIGLDDKMMMLKNQDNRCAICNEEFIEGKKVCVDHNHKTGSVRGIICMCCNMALGGIHENPEVALSLIQYIRKWNTIE